MKKRTMEMTKLIEQAMQDDLEQLTWMSPETKKQALEKLHSMVNKVGYPDKWRDYSSVDIKPDDFLGNVQRAADVRIASPARQNRQAAGPWRMGHDAAHRQRLLQSADE